MLQYLRFYQGNTVLACEKHSILIATGIGGKLKSNHILTELLLLLSLDIVY